MATSNWTKEDVERIKKKNAQHTPGTMNGQQRFQALGRLKSGQMNKTEAAFARLLETRKYAGEILWWGFEPINIRLAARTFFKVDFLVLFSDSRLEAFDVKGYWTDDAKAKIKIAAEKVPFPFSSAMLEKGQWVYEKF